MKPSPEDLKRRIRHLTDEELYLLLHVHSQNYTPEAVKVAREEFGQRHLDGPAMDRVVAAAEKFRAETKVTARTLTQDGGLQRKSTIGGWIFLILLCFGVVRGCFAGYEWLDSIGRISRTESTVISARSDWLVGESKECWSTPLSGNDAAHIGKPAGYSMSSVLCDDAGPERKMTVTFYGREVQPEYRVVNWACTRNAASFTCYQKGGMR